MIQLQKKKPKQKKQTKPTKGKSTPIVDKTVVIEDQENEPDYDPTTDETPKFGNPLSSNGVVSIQVTSDQMNNILNLKKASELTDVDELKYQNGKLRTMLQMWSDMIEHDGKLYLIQVDPLNREIRMLDEEKH